MACSGSLRLLWLAVAHACLFRLAVPFCGSMCLLCLYSASLWLILLRSFLMCIFYPVPHTFYLSGYLLLPQWLILLLRAPILAVSAAYSAMRLCCSGADQPRGGRAAQHGVLPLARVWHHQRPRLATPLPLGAQLCRQQRAAVHAARPAAAPRPLPRRLAAGGARGRWGAVGGGGAPRRRRPQRAGRAAVGARPWLDPPGQRGPCPQPARAPRVRPRLSPTAPSGYDGGCGPGLGAPTQPPAGPAAPAPRGPGGARGRC